MTFREVLMRLVKTTDRLDSVVHVRVVTRNDNNTISKVETAPVVFVMCGGEIVIEKSQLIARKDF